MLLNEDGTIPMDETVEETVAMMTEELAPMLAAIPDYHRENMTKFFESFLTCLFSEMDRIWAAEEAAEAADSDAEESFEGGCRIDSDEDDDESEQTSSTEGDDKDEQDGKQEESKKDDNGLESVGDLAERMNNLTPLYASTTDANSTVYCRFDTESESEEDEEEDNEAFMEFLNQIEPGAVFMTPCGKELGLKETLPIIDGLGMGKCDTVAGQERFAENLVRTCIEKEWI